MEEEGARRKENMPRAQLRSELNIRMNVYEVYLRICRGVEGGCAGNFFNFCFIGVEVTSSQALPLSSLFFLHVCIMQIHVPQSFHLNLATQLKLG